MPCDEDTLPTGVLHHLRMPDFQGRSEGVLVRKVIRFRFDATYADVIGVEISLADREGRVEGNIDIMRTVLVAKLLPDLHALDGVFTLSQGRTDEQEHMAQSQSADHL